MKKINIKNCGTRKGKGGCSWAGSASGITTTKVVSQGTKQNPANASHLLKSGNN